MARESKTVLVVEDSATQVMHLRALLEGVHLNVLMAVDGQMGLDMAKSIRPDLVILDLQMPRMNGFQVVQALKQLKETVNIPIIMFSIHKDIETQNMGTQLGVIEFIPKDAFADVVLLETLREMGFIDRSSPSE
jgi:PleD family two-component response regulator